MPTQVWLRQPAKVNSHRWLPHPFPLPLRLHSRPAVTPRAWIGARASASHVPSCSSAVRAEMQLGLFKREKS